ncbi:uncharacterized protein TA05320 [Theileria annulata]|uniref:Uncharacterized protein n=1 Tax=Theileria annulata TaxID=5874 RepID=Q4UCU0_THEAN|nr:uncharacterized protein TA05320 [Theileria annulata]CAI75361.1 hypothetical protein TA05320 [Theileria annulata]|eukprot:XP_954837.1 hypothetical protein TA05320 [Theileria annulata]
MKYTPVVLALLTMGLVKAAGELKVEKSEGDYLEWKKVAEKAKAVANDKKKRYEEIVAKLTADEKKLPEAEVAKLTAGIKSVTDEVDKITALESKEYKKDADSKAKAALGEKTGKLAVVLAEKVIELEGITKKADLVVQKELVKTHGHIKILDFLRSKVEALEKDGFLTSSLLSALALSALAVGATFN